MAKFKVTLDKDSGQGLFSEKDERFANFVESIMNQVLEAEMTEHLGAKRHERIETRTGYRNGDRVRQIRTQVGTQAHDRRGLERQLRYMGRPPLSKERLTKTTEKVPLSFLYP